MAADASTAAPVRAQASAGTACGCSSSWIVLSIIGCLLVALVLGPHLPPGRASEQAASQQTDITVLAAIATPVVVGVLLYFGWALAFWRQKPGDETDAAPLHGNTKVQATWIIGTSAIVLGARGLRHRRADRPGGRGRRPGAAADLPERHAARGLAHLAGRRTRTTSCRSR